MGMLNITVQSTDIKHMQRKTFGTVWDCEVAENISIFSFRNIVSTFGTLQES